MPPTSDRAAHGGATACSRAVIAQLLAQQVCDIVLAPGSRSAPLALAAEAAARAGRLRLHVRIDERTAGFLALGLAKAGGRPVPVITTSGTAVGNLLPAVQEAHHSGVPLVVLSADRPAALVGFGANQTTDQLAPFAGLLRYQARVSDAAAAQSWRAQAARAALLATGATGGRPGPVQLNLELGEPLAPVGEPRPWPATETSPVVALSCGSAEPVPLPGTPPTVVVCGDADPVVGRRAREFAEAAGLPLIAEPSSNARSGPHALATGRLLLAGRLGTEVERVVVFGHPTLSRPVSMLLARADVDVVVVSAGPDFADPGWRAALVAPAVAAMVGPASWLERWRSADQDVAERLRQVIAGPGAVTGPQVAATVLAAVPADEVLCLANSNPLRDADLAPVSDDPPAVYANRGLSGIDGTISTAAGVALACQRPTTLLCGDLAFVHDAGGLAIAPGEPRPELRIVVADDGGGSIFATLEYGEPRFADSFERVFATPTGLDLVALAAGYGVPAVRVSGLDELAAVLAEPIVGLSVVVVEVDRAGRAGLDARLRQLSR